MQQANGKSRRPRVGPSSCLPTIGGGSEPRIGGFASSALFSSAPKRLFAFWLFVALIEQEMCFGVGAATSMSNDYYQQSHQYVGSEERTNGRSSNSWAIMPLENMMSEPQALRADRMMLRLVMDATTPSASIQRNSWRSALNAQQNRNMAWERLGWGW